MLTLFKKFRDDDEGAVTVDWVVLTSGVVILGAIAVNSIWGGSNALATKIDTHVQSAGNTFIASQYW